ncbi:hypothetical protein KL86DES1_10937 [uncultured Desulfovibrio sp.]|uniref:Transposase DDE domain-containing protein n=1 Tax=uncultured Desulfovibrio sp. TaxID=167968 RepID=A0A212L153_9BACT|nr:hypothetical protein KL86DES1_10937 [uncultured Desulfovibrio sp.]
MADGCVVRKQVGWFFLKTVFNLIMPVKKMQKFLERLDMNCV